jgi:hypothetical protein
MVMKRGAFLIPVPIINLTPNSKEKVIYKYNFYMILTNSMYHDMVLVLFNSYSSGQGQSEA